MRSIYGIYFICCRENYLDIVNEQLQTMLDSSLYTNIKNLLIFICLYDENSRVKLQQIFNKYDTDKKFILITTPLNLYEKFAINTYKSYIPDELYYVFYFHTKSGNNIRQNLNFYTLTKFNISLDLLKECDCVGCSLSLYPLLHFSGNFWWSKSEHTDKLKMTIDDKYLSPEMYICSREQGKYISLSQNTNYTDLNCHINLTDQDILAAVEQNKNNIIVIHACKHVLDDPYTKYSLTMKGMPSPTIIYPY